MASTRIINDDVSIQNQYRIYSEMDRFQLCKPIPQQQFFNDPYIRMQQWGANLATNSADINECLWRNKEVDNTPMLPNYKVNNSQITDQSRTTHPAWMSKSAQLPFTPIYKTPTYQPTWTPYNSKMAVLDSFGTH